MSELVSSLKEQSKAILVMMSISIIAVIAMVVLDNFNVAIRAMSGLGNGTGSTNVTAQALVTLFILRLVLLVASPQ